MEDLDYQQVLSVLGQSKIIHWDPVMSGGKPLFDRLANDMLQEPNPLNERQQTNALMVLFRLRGWGCQESLTAALKVALQSTAIEVRDQAAKLTAGLVRLGTDESHKNERIDVSTLVGLLPIALERGVSANTADLIRSVLPADPD